VLAPLGARGVELVVTASGPVREPQPSGDLPATLRGPMADDSG
jgi:hypothetical protein